MSVPASASRLKLVFSALWLALFTAAGATWLRSDLALAEIPDRIAAWIGSFGVGRAALLYVLLYTLRPLLLFPATLLTIASGLAFGPWLGIVFTVVGENASANFAFAIARWLGRDWVMAREDPRVAAWDERIRENALVSVLLMRLLYLPFDAVNYGCGLTAMRQRDFFVATALGILPGLVSFVLLGGAGASGMEHRLMLVALSAFFFLLGLGIARVLRGRAP